MSATALLAPDSGPRPGTMAVLVFLVAAGCLLTLSLDGYGLRWITSRLGFLQVERLFSAIAPLCIATVLSTVLTGHASRAPGREALIASTTIAFALLCGYANFERLRQLGLPRQLRGRSVYLVEWPGMVACGVGAGAGTVLVRGSPHEVAFAGFLLLGLYARENWTRGRYHSDDAAVLVVTPFLLIGTALFLAEVQVHTPVYQESADWLNKLLGFEAPTPLATAVAVVAGGISLVVAELGPPLFYKAWGKPYPLAPQQPRLKYLAGTAEAEVEAAELHLIALLAQNDVGTLRKLLGPRHLAGSDERGRTWRRREWIDEIISGVRRYESATVGEIEVIVYGKTAVVAAPFSAATRARDGTRATLEGRRLDVWLKKNDRWRLIASQIAHFAPGPGDPDSPSATPLN